MGMIPQNVERHKGLAILHKPQNVFLVIMPAIQIPQKAVK